MGSRGMRVMVVAAGFAAASSFSAAADPCTDMTGAQIFHAVAVRDGTSIATSEGAGIALAGIVAAAELDGDAEAAKRAAQALDRLVTGRQILVRAGAERPDRYGRIVGQVAVMGSGSPLWVQGAMLEAGEARVSAVSSGSCTAALLRAEAAARTAGKGTWSDPRFAVHGAGDLERLTAAEGRFMVVEGLVRRTGESGGRIYLDFGQRFNEDFSVIVPRDAHKAFTNAGIDLRSLEGARVRVRGVVIVRGGPAIELRDPAAIERLKAGGA